MELLYEELRSSRLVTNIRLSPKISIQMLARETSSAFLWAAKLARPSKLGRSRHLFTISRRKFAAGCACASRSPQTSIAVILKVLDNLLYGPDTKARAAHMGRKFPARVGVARSRSTCRGRRASSAPGEYGIQLCASTYRIDSPGRVDARWHGHRMSSQSSVGQAGTQTRQGWKIPWGTRCRRSRSGAAGRRSKTEVVRIGEGHSQAIITFHRIRRSVSSAKGC